MSSLRLPKPFISNLAVVKKKPFWLGDPGPHCLDLLCLQHDPHRPEDVLKLDCDDEGVGGDDAADCLRYLVATKGRTVTQRKLRGV